MKLRVIKQGERYLAQYKGWFFWHACEHQDSYGGDGDFYPVAVWQNSLEEAVAACHKCVNEKKIRK